MTKDSIYAHRKSNGGINLLLGLDDDCYCLLGLIVNPPQWLLSKLKVGENTEIEIKIKEQ